MQFTNPFEDKPTSTAAVWVGSAGGSLLYGLSELGTFDLVAKVGALSPEIVGGVFSLVGGLALASDFGVLQLEGTE